MNSITIAEIKRGGMLALDAALNQGITHIMKRNRVAAVVLTPAAYENLLARALPAGSSTSALDWLLQQNTITTKPEQNDSGLDQDAMAQRLDELKSGWNERP